MHVQWGRSLRLVATSLSFATLTALAGHGAAARADGIQQIIPADRLATIKAALPKVGYPALQSLFTNPDTLWYDEQVMSPSYQETGLPGGGAQDNAHWLRLIADSLQDTAHKIYDADKLRWRFPFQTTAGTDDSDDLVVENFINVPVAGRPIHITTQQDDIHLSWVWTYPQGTVAGEVLFIKAPDGSLLPTEVRTRTRGVDGWATNVFRPFTTAAALDAAIKAHRPNWAAVPALATMVAHLENNNTLTPKQLTATGLPGTFDQAGYLDVLPDFGDPALVKELLTTTTFVTAYGAVWKQNGDQKTYAPSTASSPSIVPRNYTLGVIEVSDESCARCHQSTGMKLENWYQPITLYGEIWGKDGIFSFHPFDEKYFQDLDLDEVDNRHVNPVLEQMGLFTGP